MSQIAVAQIALAQIDLAFDTPVAPAGGPPGSFWRRPLRLGVGMARRLAGTRRLADGRAAAASSETSAPTEAEDFSRVGFEIGWDHAHHRLAPPVEHLSPGHPVRQGWEAGLQSFGNRTLRTSPWVRKWLNLRLNAFGRGLSFDALHVTPHLLERLHAGVSHCPITRAPLTQATGGADDATVDRVDNGIGYRPGNLAVLSRGANQAKSNLGFREAIERVERIEAERLGGIDGLSIAHWSRLAVLCSFTTALSHDEAARLPLLLLPPTRLRVVNPSQGLQVLLTTLLTQAGYARRLAEVAGRVQSPSARQALQVFMHTLLARRVALGPNPSALSLRHGLEDAWRHPLVNQRWQAFALQMTAASVQRLLEASLGQARGAGVALAI
jgi:hypothetical protein